MCGCSVSPSGTPALRRGRLCTPEPETRPHAGQTHSPRCRSAALCRGVCLQRTLPTAACLRTDGWLCPAVLGEDEWKHELMSEGVLNAECCSPAGEIGACLGLESGRAPSQTGYPTSPAARAPSSLF